MPLCFFFVNVLSFRKEIVTLQQKTWQIDVKMKTKTEILHLLKLYKPIAKSKYGLTRIGIFGSVARGEQTEHSDVDVCYDGRVPSLLTIDRIQSDLEQMFDCHVDLVRIRKDVNSLLQQRIKKEGLYV